MKAYTGKTTRLDVCTQTPPEPVYQIVLTEDALRYGFEVILPALIGMIALSLVGVVFLLVLGCLR